MNNGEYFKIDTVEELKQAYQMFKDEWWPQYNSRTGIEFLGENLGGYRFIVRDCHGIYLSSKIEGKKEISSPLKNKKEKCSLQKTLEIGDLNISILKYLTANGIVDEKLTGAKAQEIVDKIDELSKIILK